MLPTNSKCTSHCNHTKQRDMGYRTANCTKAPYVLPFHLVRLSRLLPLQPPPPNYTKVTNSEMWGGTSFFLRFECSGGLQVYGVYAYMQ